MTGSCNLPTTTIDNFDNNMCNSNRSKIIRIRIEGNHQNLTDIAVHTTEGQIIPISVTANKCKSTSHGVIFAKMWLTLYIMLMLQLLTKLRPKELLFCSIFCVLVTDIIRTCHIIPIPCGHDHLIVIFSYHGKLSGYAEAKKLVH